jgi:hypothetical protein
MCACVLILAVAALGRSQERLGPPLYKIDDAYLHWPLLPEYRAYARIQGQPLKQYVNEITAISRRSRDAGNQYWGRIAGMPSDKETQQWLTTRFKGAGLDDVRLQEFPMTPFWYPTSWDVSVTNGKTSVVTLKSARPVQWAAATPPGGLELEATWVGLGDPADFLGRDVRGKAVFIYSMPTPGMRDHSAMWNGAMKRAEDQGAAAVVVVFALPGNVSSQLISTQGVHVPLFSVGLADGVVIRQMVERAEHPRVRMRLAVEMATGKTTANVWGTLPGATDETIFVVAHYDAHFDGALDNASGMATMVGLADYFAKVPKAERRRTMVFVGLPAHHTAQGANRDISANLGSYGARWIHDNRGTVLAKTALIINCEHTSQTQTYLSGPELMKSNTVSARRWFVGGSEGLKRLVVDVFDRFGVATYEMTEASPGGELSILHRDAPGLHVIDQIFYHTDMDTSEYVPAAGMEGVTRAYARVIDEVNRQARQAFLAAETK